MRKISNLVSLKNILYCKSERAKFFLVGLIYQLCKSMTSSGVLDPHQVPSFTLKAMEFEELKGLELPVVFLDEFSWNIAIGSAIITLLRNIFRVCHARTVVMGTNARAANIFQHGVQWSRPVDPGIWMYIWTALPPFHASFYQEIKSLCAVTSPGHAETHGASAVK